MCLIKNTNLTTLNQALLHSRSSQLSPATKTKVEYISTLYRDIIIYKLKFLMFIFITVDITNTGNFTFYQ